MSFRLEHMIGLYQEHLKVALKLEAQGKKFPGARVVVITDEAPEQTKGGIIIPDTALQGAPAIGTVVGIGVSLDPDEYEGVEQTLKVGDRVAMSKYGGTRIEMYLDGADEEPTEIQFLPVNDVYVYWDPQPGTELANGDLTAATMDKAIETFVDMEEERFDNDYDRTCEGAREANA